jgi:hypothetical protein
MVIIKTSSYDSHNDTNEDNGEANDDTKVGNKGKNANCCSFV